MKTPSKDYEELIEKILDASDTHDTQYLSCQLKRLTLDSLPEGILETFACAIKKRSCKPFETQLHLMDVCGTGGDGKNTFNISTLTAIVLGALDVPIAKHGNRAQSGNFGSFDLIDALAIPYQFSPKELHSRLLKYGLVFLFAPEYHPSLKAIAPIRRSIKQPTIFNLLGPLLNPMPLTHQVIGVYHQDFLYPMSEAMKSAGISRGAVLCGYDGLDELSLEGENHVILLEGNQLTPLVITPKHLPVTLYCNEALRATSKQHALSIANSVLQGQSSPYLEALCLNAGFALWVRHPQRSLEACIVNVRQKLSEGHVFNYYMQLTGKGESYVSR